MAFRAHRTIISHSWSYVPLIIRLQITIIVFSKVLSGHQQKLSFWIEKKAAAPWPTRFQERECRMVVWFRRLWSMVQEHSFSNSGFAVYKKIAVRSIATALKWPYTSAYRFVRSHCGQCTRVHDSAYTVFGTNVEKQAKETPPL